MDSSSKKEYNINRKIFKKSPEELQLYLSLMRKHGVVSSKKGKGSYKRKQKHKGSDYNDNY